MISIFYILSILLVASSTTIYSVANNILLPLFCMCLIACNFYYLLTNKIRHIVILSVVLYLVCIIICYLAWKNITGYSILILLIMIPNIYLFIVFSLNRNNLCKFISCFLQVAAVCGAVSIFFWFFGSITNLVHPTNNVMLKWGDTYRLINSYYGLYFEPQNTSINFAGIHIGVKNSSIFPEGTVSCFFYLVCFFLNEVCKFKKYYLYISIFLISIVSTFTTLSQVCLILICLYYILFNKSNSKILRLFKLLFFIVSFLFAVHLIYQLFIGKLETHSGIVRYSKIVCEITSFLHAPLFGNGFNTATNGSSNSFFSLLADGGIILWAAYYIPILKSFSIKDVQFKFLVAIFLSAFIFTAVQYSPLPVVIICYLIRRKNYDFNNYPCL